MADVGPNSSAWSILNRAWRLKPSKQRTKQPLERKNQPQMHETAHAHLNDDPPSPQEEQTEPETIVEEILYDIATHENEHIMGKTEMPHEHDAQGCSSSSETNAEIIDVAELLALANRLLEVSDAQKQPVHGLKSLDQARSTEEYLERQRAEIEGTAASLRCLLDRSQNQSQQLEPTRESEERHSDDEDLAIQKLESQIRDLTSGLQNVRNAISELDNDDWFRDVSARCLAPLFARHEKQLVRLRARQDQIESWLHDNKLQKSKDFLESVTARAASEADKYRIIANNARHSLDLSPAIDSIKDESRLRRAQRLQQVDEELKREFTLEQAARDARMSRRGELRQSARVVTGGEVSTHGIVARAPWDVSHVMDSEKLLNPRLLDLAEKLGETREQSLRESV